MSEIKTKQVLSYMLLPGLGPRIKRLFGSGFGMISFLVAQVYGLVRLLPPAHPYLNPENIGRFNVLHVIGEAANHLVISRKNIDQIIIFAIILLGMVLFAAQIGLLAYALVISKAFAQNGFIQGGSLGMFATPNPYNDVALNLLDRVFGIPYFFCSPAGCSAVNAELPWPMHDALHALLGFYSYGLLVVGLIIFLYFIVVIIGETAVSGTPFGQRFQNVWVPVRLLLAVSLLVPVNHSLNGAQYITLFAAKMGSGLATNAWLNFNETIKQSDMFARQSGANPVGELETLVGPPSQPYLAGVLQAMSIIHACSYDEWRDRNLQTSGGNEIAAGSYLNASNAVRPYIIRLDGHMELPRDLKNGFEEALEFSRRGPISIVWGKPVSGNPSPGDGSVGGIIEICGKMRVPVSQGLTDEQIRNVDSVGGPVHIMRTYFQLVQRFWYIGNLSNSIPATINIDHHPIYKYAVRMVEAANPSQTNAYERGCTLTFMGLPTCRENTISRATGEWKSYVLSKWIPAISTSLTEAHELYVQNGVDLEIEQDILRRGWGGAGIWYNRIAELNGNIQGAAMDVPELTAYPKLMENVRDINRQQNAEIAPIDLFSTRVEGNSYDGRIDASQVDNAEAMNSVYVYWNSDLQGGDDPELQVSLNIFEHAMRIVLGAGGIFDIRGENALVHPLAQLTIIGKGMVENTIRNMAVATSTAFLGGFMGGAGMQGAGIMKAISGFFFSTAFIGLTAGIVLFYVMPFLPFVYFFFAVGQWLKSIFEAMVGAPLWALAHMRIDGEGLPGEAAANGYFLIFEIFIRPILIVVGFLAAIIIFGAQVRILNFIWDLVVVNSAGYTPDTQYNFNCSGENPGFMCSLGDMTGFKRSTMDQFFFTVIYTMMVYMLGTATFKLIDMIPDNILRWFGSGASTFSDQTDDPAQNLSRYVAVAGMLQGQNLASGVKGLAEGLGGAAGQVFKSNPQQGTPNLPTGNTLGQR